MFELDLPEPALSLYARTHDLLDRFLPDVVPSGGVWAIGGGTVLGALWQHRRSTDLDIFMPSDSGLSAISPNWDRTFTDRMGERGASNLLVQTRGLKFQFESGRLELTALDPNPPLDPIAVSIDGHARHILPVACILTGKLAGRGLRLPARDVFDIGVGVRQSADAMACAVNHLDPQTRAEIIARLLANEDAYRADAPEVILDPDPRWEHLLEDGSRVAAEGISDMVYRKVNLDFYGGRARVSVTNRAFGGTHERDFNSPADLVAGITAMGLRPRMIAQHGTIEKFMNAAGREFEARGSTRLD